MVDPDVAEAIPKMVARGILPAASAPRLLRVARGELVSVRLELRALLYAGVLLVAAGVGVLVKDNLERLGPVAIASGIGLGAALCFVWVVRKAPAFSWGPAVSTDLAFDYVLLLGVLLASADLAYVEAKFTLLGEAWAWHLLIVALFAGFVALRYDSRVVFSLALSSFTAWRGASLSTLERGLFDDSDAVSMNAVACGVLFVVLGAALAWRDAKAHFEPVAVHLGWLLILGGLYAWAQGLTDIPVVGSVALLTVSAGLAIYAYGKRRFPLLAMGIAGSYLGLSMLVCDALYGVAILAWIVVSSLGTLLGLLALHRRMKEPS